jgi:hypothetical protein
MFLNRQSFVLPMVPRAWETVVQRKKNESNVWYPYVPSPICSIFSKQSTLRDPHEGTSSRLSCPGLANAIFFPRFLHSQGLLSSLPLRLLQTSRNARPSSFAPLCHYNDSRDGSFWKLFFIFLAAIALVTNSHSHKARLRQFFLERESA